MNNLHYIAIQKAASWTTDKNMQARCVAEFHAVNPSDTLDTPALAIAAAKRNGIAQWIIDLFAPLTTGHLANNGGLRGHSAGEVFPFRVMAQGLLDSLVWHVIKPNGEKLGKGHTTSRSAHKVARFAHAIWSR